MRRLDILGQRLSGLKVKAVSQNNVQTGEYTKYREGHVHLCKYCAAQFACGKEIAVSVA